MQFNIDSWYWKFAVLFGLLGMREFIRLLSPKDKSSEGSETSKWLIETIDSAAIAIGLVLFVIQPFILQAFYIPSGSMEDTLRISDRLLVSKMVYRLRDPQFQDVVVFKAPQDALASSGTAEGTDFIKRCMGTPGDVVYVINRKVYRNGKPIDEPYTKWGESSPGMESVTNSPDSRATESVGNVSYDMKIVDGIVYSRNYEYDQPGRWQRNGMVEDEANQDIIEKAAYGSIPPGKFLMLGDHRSNSNDGHFWGFVPRENVVGKAICVFWPPTRLGLVDQMSIHPRKP